MNTPDDLDLLRRLKALPREREPAAELWDGIAARIEPRAARRGSRGWIVGLALAASAALVAVLATRAPDADPAPAVVQQPTAPASLPAGNEFVRREAEAITLEYRLALESFAGEALPPELETAATELDDSARRIRSALREEPDAVYLLDRLRRTYDQRLKLSQRALLG
jgi:hypothetical protein